MKNLFLLLLTFATALIASKDAAAQEFPAPVKEHEWLHRFVGEWTSKSELTLDSEKEPLHGTGTENVTKLGGFWILARGSGEMGGMSLNYLLSLGYDPVTKKYIGTWMDSLSSHLWRYEGTVDDSGNILTLYSERPHPTEPGKMSRFREVTTFLTQDHRTFTSALQNDKGEWVTLITGESHRKP